MNSKAKAVLAGWVALDATERDWVEKEIARYRKGAANPQIREEFAQVRKSVVLGPLSGGCPCCGR